MNLKEQIIKFLNEETEQYRCTESGDCRAIGNDNKEDTEYLADELIKLFSLNIVSKRQHLNAYDWGYINGYDDCNKGLPKRDDLGVYDD